MGPIPRDWIMVTTPPATSTPEMTAVCSSNPSLTIEEKASGTPIMAEKATLKCWNGNASHWSGAGRSSTPTMIPGALLLEELTAGSVGSVVNVTSPHEWTNVRRFDATPDGLSKGRPRLDNPDPAHHLIRR